MREISFSLLVEKIFEEKMACIQCWINEKPGFWDYFPAPG